MNSVYSWHPLFNYVMQVKHDYFKNLFELHENGLINDDYFGVAIENCVFKYWLEFLNDVVYDKDEFGNSTYNLDKVFKPLIINQYGDYVLFKYGSYIDLAEQGYGIDFFKLYDSLFLECRSVVIDIKNERIALASMSKFKNYGEDTDVWSEDNIQNLIINSRKVEITNKMDGSYQQYRYIIKDNLILGSGSQALNPKESWRLERGYSIICNSKNQDYVNLLKDYPSYTFMFEFISPDNAIVVNYTKEDEGLYLFNARNVYTGEEMDFNQLQELAKKYNVKIVDYYTNATLDSILQETKNYTSNEKEGWVIKIYDKNNNFLRVKVKIDDYVLMHKALSKIISPNAVIESVIDNKWDDLYAKIPSAYKDNAKEIHDNINLYLKLMQDKINSYKILIGKYLPNEYTQKEYMIAVDNLVPKNFRGYLKNLYLNRPLNFLTTRGAGHIKYKEILKFLEEN